MRKLISLFLVFLLVACVASNEDIYKAQQVQTIYFEIVENPVYMDKAPNSWGVYSEDVIKRAKELYIIKTNRTAE